jgi:phage-related protein
MKFEIQFYKKSNKNPIMDFILSLEEETQLDILALLKKMEDDPFTLGTMSKKIKGVKNLFELRIKGRNKIIRLFYCYKKNKIIIVLHGFIKKTQKIPPKELELAIKRKKEIENE